MKNPDRGQKATEEYHAAVVDYHSLEALSQQAEIHEKSGENPVEAFKLASVVLREKIRLAESPLKQPIQKVIGQELPT
jgi:hypothetical protein